MNTLPCPSHSVASLLVPPRVLPAEGDDWPLHPISNRSPVPGELAAFQQIVSPLATRFRISGSTIEVPADSSLPSELMLADLTPADEEGIVGLEVDSTLAHMNWAAVLEGFERRTSPDIFLGDQNEALRIFLGEVRSAGQAAARGFAGEPLPLVEIVRQPDQSSEVAFLGFWLATPADRSNVLAGQSTVTASNLGAGDGSLVIVDETEVEARGIREGALGLSMLALVFAGQARAGLSDLFRAGPTPVVHAHQARHDGTALAVKSQRLTQEAPKVYPSGLFGRDSTSEHKVVIDIKAQRAYLFIEDRLAFETPVSTASKGRHTPRGTFQITEKVRSGKRSTIYKCAMPFWMRLDQSPIGMHVGHLPGYPASHGCVRMPAESAQFIFDNAPRGTTVRVVDSLPAAPQPAPPAPDHSLVAAQ